MEIYGLILWAFQSEDSVMSSLPCSGCVKGPWALGRPLVALPSPFCSHGYSRSQIKVIHFQTEPLIIWYEFSFFLSLFVIGDTDLHVSPQLPLPLPL